MEELIQRGGLPYGVDAGVMRAVLNNKGFGLPHQRLFWGQWFAASS